MAPTTQKPPSLLASEITKRLAGLRISRREFVRRTGLSRQTLHNVEREGLTDLWPTTFKALDRGLEWPEGTAKQLAAGDVTVIDEVLSLDQRLTMLRNQLMHGILQMDLPELSHLIDVMEKHVFNRSTGGAAEHVQMVEARLDRMEQFLSDRNNNPGAKSR